MRHQGAKSFADLDAMLQRTAADCDACLAGLSDAQAVFAPEGEWCAKEVIGHVLTSNRGINQQIADMAGIANPAGESAKTRAMGERSLEEEKLPITDLRAKVAAVFQDNRRLAEALQSSNKLDQKFPHPLFGPLNLKEWIAFHRLHAMDHIQQIEKIRSDAAYPPA